MTGEPLSSAARIRELMRTCWSRASSTLWSAENTARGQCGVTALVIQDHLGGEILKTQVGDAWHFYNRIEGTRLDFTAEQFDHVLDYQDLLSDRTEAFADTNALQYTALCAAFTQALRRQAPAHWTPLTDGATIRSGGG